MANMEELIRRIESLEERVLRGEDKDQIERLQFIYGFYLDNRMWRELADMFCDENPSIEIGRRGSYVGKERIHRFLSEVLGEGRWGLLKNEIINHLQLQPVITVAPDHRSAKMRSRAVMQGSSPPDGNTMLWSEGIYENDYIKDNGVWKIKRVWWVPTFYAQIPGFETASYQSGPESENFPPDHPSAPQDAALGRSFLPFHYLHPFTGSEVPSPSARRDGKSGG